MSAVAVVAQAPTGAPGCGTFGGRRATASLELGQRRLKDGDLVAAVVHFGAALAARPGFTQAHAARGWCLLATGEAAKAQVDFEHVIAQDVGCSRNIYVLLALSLARQEDHWGAIRCLGRCLSFFPTFQLALAARGELHLKVQDYPHAQVDFQALLQEAPGHLAARRGLGDALRGIGNLHGSAAQYSHCLDTLLAQAYGALSGEGDASGFDGRGASGMASSTTDDDLELLQDSGRVPSQPNAFIGELLLRRALVLRAAGDLGGAGSDLATLIQHEPDHGLALFWYGKLLIEQRCFDEAPAYLEASLPHHPATCAPAHALLGTLLLTAPEPDCDGACEHLREAARLLPGSPAIRVTHWICSAAVALKSQPPDARLALGFLDRALADLAGHGSPGVSGDGGAEEWAGAAAGRKAPWHSSHGFESLAVPYKTLSLAGNGAAAAGGLMSSRRSSHERSARRSAFEEPRARKKTLRSWEDDLRDALDCSTYFQFFTWQPEGAAAPHLLYALRAVALCSLGRFGEASVDCQKALAANSNVAVQYNFHLATGVWRAQCSEHEVAIGHFTKALRLRPGSEEARLHRAIALVEAARVHGLGGSAECGRRWPALLSDAARDAALDGTDEAAPLQSATAASEVAPMAAFGAGSSIRLQRRARAQAAATLRAACFCALGRFSEALALLCAARCQGGKAASGDLPDEDDFKSEAPGCLEIEILVYMGRYEEAIEASDEVLSSGKEANVVALHLLRAQCWSELQEPELCFEDCRRALLDAPDCPGVHEANGDILLQRGCYAEAIIALTTAAKLGGSLSVRQTYLRAIAHLATRSPDAALSDLCLAARHSPSARLVARARDGVSALIMMLDGNYRKAASRFKALLIEPLTAVATVGGIINGGGGIGGTLGASALNSLGMPNALFQPHEILRYRATSLAYLGEFDAAARDFRESIHAATGAREATEGSANKEGDDRAPRRRPPAELATAENLECYACEMLYNEAMCHLMAGDWEAAASSVDELLAKRAALASLGQDAQGLAWFLLGACYIAGEHDGTSFASKEYARECFRASYEFDSTFVTTCLSRQHALQISSFRPPAPSLRARKASNRFGLAGATDVAGTAPQVDAVCFRRGAASVGGRLPPLLAQVGELAVRFRFATDWPHIQAPAALPPPTAGAEHPELPSHSQVGVTALLPWAAH